MSDAFPYLTALNSVLLNPWMLADVDGAMRILPDSFPEWDYATDLSLRNRIEIDMGKLREETALPSNAAIGVTVIWSSSAAKLRRAGVTVAIPEDGIHVLELDLCGADLGGELQLKTDVVLLDDVTNAPPIAPSLAGSIIWSKTHLVRLQGANSTFPTAVVDIASEGRDPATPWFLELPTILEEPFMNGAQLLINERTTRLVDAIAAASKPQPHQQVINSMLCTEVARTMIEHALSLTDFDLEEEYPEDSLGLTLQSLIRRTFPGMTLNTLQGHRNTDPSTWASLVAARLHVLS